jgi:hypothetical protein
MLKSNEVDMNLPLPVARLVPGVEYIGVLCETCNKRCVVDHMGLDPVIPRLKITCPNCGELGTWKLYNHGQAGR